MPFEDRDPAFLWDMLEAAQKIRSFVAGKDLDEYLKDDLLRSAVERRLEILGEAARRVSAEFARKHPEIPWSGLVGLRNVLSHRYGEIKNERIWQVATVDVPKLITALAPLVPPPPGNPA